MADYSKLKRALNEIPPDVKSALAARDLTENYFARPAYQQNDYISWITRAKREETRSKRLNQMLDELEKGGIYMKMEHPPSAR